MSDAAAPPCPIDKQALATLRFTLRHESDGVGVRHEDVLFGRRVNFWRDILPPALEAALRGAVAGHVTTLDLPPGELAPAYSEAKVMRLPLARFVARRIGDRFLRPRRGRFYPLGLLPGLPGVNPSMLQPFRVLDLDDRELLVDLNHPLAQVPCRLEVAVLDTARRITETGGRLTHWLEAMADGPGIQRPLSDGFPDFFDPEAFRREDEADDAAFYAAPRLVGHVDAACSERLAALHGRLLSPGDRVLDLMSSLHSHLPEALELAAVTGLGMNAEELRANPRLTRHLVQDLNRDPRLPFEDGAFDVALCALSVEYLIDPLAVLREARRVLRPGGLCVLTVSQRWFPGKAIALWAELHPYERLGFLTALLHAAGFADLHTCSDRGHPRPREDRYFPQLRESDPLLAAWGTAG